MAVVVSNKDDEPQQQLRSVVTADADVNIRIGTARHRTSTRQSSMYQRQLADDVRSIERNQAITRDETYPERDPVERASGIVIDESSVETNPAPADD